MDKNFSGDVSFMASSSQFSDLIDIQFSREIHTGRIQLAQKFYLTRVVSRQLRGGMNFETRKVRREEMEQSQILNNDSIDPRVYQFVQDADELREVAFDENDIQGQINATVMSMGKSQDPGQLVKRDVRRPVPGIEFMDAAVDRVRPRDHGGFDGVHVSAGSQ